MLDLVKYNVKREIFKGDIIEIKNKIVEIIKKEFKINKVYVHEPDIKIGDLSECRYCNKCFYTKNDLFDHINTCNEYKEYLSKKKEGKFECKYCDKEFSRIDNLTRHFKTCKDKKKTDEANENMLELVKLLIEQKQEFKTELEKKNNQIDELIKKAGINNSTITQNIQNNIKLLAYDKTDISDLTEKDFIRCFNHNNMCVPHLVKRIHFNPKKPENHNVFISNLKSGHIMIYDGRKWNTFNRDEIVDDIFDDKHDILEQKYEEWISIGKDYPIIYHKFKRYLEKINNDIVLKKVKDELKFTLYNNRNVVKKIK